MLRGQGCCSCDKVQSIGSMRQLQEFSEATIALEIPGGLHLLSRALLASGLDIPSYGQWSGRTYGGVA